MISRRFGLCAALGIALGLGACADGYGYGGVGLGYNDGYGAYGGYYDDPYYGGYGYGSGYGVGYAPSYFGWYGNYYYPGAGVYVYDNARRRYRWNNAQQRYWGAQQRYRGRDWNGQGSWNGFDRGNRDWQDRRDGVRGQQDRRGDRNGYVQGYRGAQGQGYRANPRVQNDGSGRDYRNRTDATPRADRGERRSFNRGGDRSQSTGVRTRER